MGRVKNTQVKNLGHELLEKHKDRFKADFVTNKQVINEVQPIKSKKIRNIVAGYITRRMTRDKGE